MALLRVVIVGLLVVSAGCVGFGVGASDTGSVATAGQAPPGVDGGIVNATALVRAHERSLDGVGVDLATTWTHRSSVPGESNRTVRTRTLTDGNGTLWRRAVTAGDGDERRVERWIVGGRGFRHVVGGRTGRTDGMGPTARYRTARLERWLATGRYHVAAIESGTPERYVLTTTTYATPGGDPREADTVRYEAQAVVTGEGRVTAFSATLVTIERNKWGRQTRIRSYSYRLARTGGVRVSRPGWVPDIRADVEVADG
ncbi:hypothetical protein [Haloarcula pellucida]|uniref:Uncharacterized protein n=1 Tax=Haloarcula pellucida TaxID=1427151 RepID=A0A830GPW7_9EURY|nr:hypothetical protein [Halomicroarcula pellucida]MBX0350343.1 hypothetical protein [Halomicroarcula pellucida]GGO01611.1 hypothetical protein GCM10009030_35460 [Halomicroarcula pellucida]